MLDFRINTFLEVCRCKNYTRAAENLNITQPAVTQHIQYLQQYYGAKLLVYRNKQLTLTPEGELLRRATLTIGEYLLPERVAFYSQAGEGRLAKG